MATALIKITQGATTDLAGRAVKGSLAGGTVVFSNGDNTGVASWKYELLYVPPGSAIPTTVQGPGLTSTFTMAAPDVPGSYRVRLTVTDSLGATDVDIRNFSVPFTGRGFIAPPYEGVPLPLPLVGNGDPAAKPHELNFGGQPFGWDGQNSTTYKMMYRVLKEMSEFTFTLPSNPGDDGKTVIAQGGDFTYVTPIPAGSPLGTSRTINTTAPLQGGGDLSVDRTFSVSTLSNLTSGVVPAISVALGVLLSNGAGTSASWTALSGGGSAPVGTGRTISTTAPLTGGGALSSNLTLAVNTVGSATAGVVPQISGADRLLKADGTGANATWVVQSGGGSPVGSLRAINTTAPLAGGGDLSADRTLSVATLSNTSSGVVPAITAALSVLLSNGGGTAGTWVTLSGGGSAPVGVSRTISTTAPLTGGGDLSANRTFAVNTVGAATSGVVPLISAANALLKSDGTGTSASWAAQSGTGNPLGTGRTINTTSPLQGGGDLSADRTLSILTLSNTTSGVAPAITAANSVLQSNGAGSSAVWVSLSGGGGVPVGVSRTINTTAPLQGGGNLSADRTLSVAVVSDLTSGVVPAITAADSVLQSNGAGTAAIWVTLSGGGGVPVGISRAINTTAPLQGGGDLSTDRTLSVSALSNTTSGVVAAISAALSVLMSNGAGTAGTWVTPSGGGSAPVGTGRTISTTAPLTGGGDLSANRTLAVNTLSNTSSGVVPLISAANALLKSNGAGTAGTWVAQSGTGSPLGTGRLINTTAPLLGGGDLSADRTLSVSTLSNTTSGVVAAITVASSYLQSNGAGTAAVWVATSGGGTAVGTSRTISTTAPLQGGGDLSANRTLSITAVTNTTPGVAVAVGAAGTALISTGTAAAWGTNFGAQNVTIGGYLALAQSGLPSVGAIRMPNNSAITSTTSGGTDISVVLIDNSDVLFFGSGTNTDTVLRAAAGLTLQIAGSNVVSVTATEVTLSASSGTMVHVIDLGSGRRAVGLLSTLNTTKMPANSGDGVLYLGNASAIPTTGNPSSGSVVFVDSTGTYVRGPSGSVNQFGFS